MAPYKLSFIIIIYTSCMGSAK